MKLCDCYEKDFTGLKSWDGVIKGTWLGSPEPGGRHFIVPIRHVPDEVMDGFFIRPSNSNRPIIQGGAKSSSGFIARFSSLGTGERHNSPGRIYIEPGADIIIILNGSGITPNGTHWEDALIAINSFPELPIRVFVESASFGQDVLYTFTDKVVKETCPDYEIIEEMRKWARPHSKDFEKWSANA